MRHTLLIRSIAARANTARQAGEQARVAADAFHVESAAAAEAGHAAAGAGWEAGDTGAEGGAREQRAGDEGKGAGMHGGLAVE